METATTARPASSKGTHLETEVLLQLLTWDPAAERAPMAGFHSLPTASSQSGKAAPYEVQPHEAKRNGGEAQRGGRALLREHLKLASYAANRPLMAPSSQEQQPALRGGAAPQLSTDCVREGDRAPHLSSLNAGKLERRETRAVRHRGSASSAGSLTSGMHTRCPSRESITSAGEEDRACPSTSNSSGPVEQHSGLAASQGADDGQEEDSEGAWQAHSPGEISQRESKLFDLQNGVELGPQALAAVTGSVCAQREDGGDACGEDSGGGGQDDAPEHRSSKREAVTAPASSSLEGVEGCHVPSGGGRLCHRLPKVSPRSASLSCRGLDSSESRPSAAGRPCGGVQSASTDAETQTAAARAVAAAGSRSSSEWLAAGADSCSACALSALPPSVGEEKSRNDVETCEADGGENLEGAGKMEQPWRGAAGMSGSFLDDARLFAHQGLKRRGAGSSRGSTCSSKEGSDTVPSYANSPGHTDAEECSEGPDDSPRLRAGAARPSRDDTADISADGSRTVNACASVSTSASEMFPDLRHAADELCDSSPLSEDDEEERQVREQLVRLQRRLQELQQRQQQKRQGGLSRSSRASPGAKRLRCSGGHAAETGDAREGDSRRIPIASRPSTLSTMDASSHCSRESAAANPGGERSSSSSPGLPGAHAASAHSSGAFSLPEANSPLHSSIRALADEDRTLLTSRNAETEERGSYRLPVRRMAEAVVDAADLDLGSQTAGEKESGPAGGSADISEAVCEYSRGSPREMPCGKRKHVDDEDDCPRQKGVDAGAEGRFIQAAASSLLSLLVNARAHDAANASGVDQRIPSPPSSSSVPSPSAQNGSTGAAAELLLQILASSQAAVKRASATWQQAAAGALEMYMPASYSEGHAVPGAHKGLAFWSGDRSCREELASFADEPNGLPASLLSLLGSAAAARTAADGQASFGGRGRSGLADRWQGASENWRAKEDDNTGDFGSSRTFAGGMGSGPCPSAGFTSPHAPLLRRAARAREHSLFDSEATTQLVSDMLGRGDSLSRALAGVASIAASAAPRLFPEPDSHGYANGADAAVKTMPVRARAGRSGEQELFTPLPYGDAARELLDRSAVACGSFVGSPHCDAGSQIRPGAGLLTDGVQNDKEDGKLSGGAGTTGAKAQRVLGGKDKI
ncbi:hypothetical protein BESB_018630 [Besnoitia besnoiti]|uniref:Uncharacterized protein n=1 Tax=Besnoitia besnoiti TaxID=94643 RepID=A0A2A9M3K8_BESBE|nr:hypothetical protein BESB_018630 [Besnoitia besnoiti]PFH32545.1 hypothetical protein BESB_018630 [Besnoitia besnoiti]